MAEDVASTPAAPGSALARFRQARAKALQGLTVDLQVPGYDPPLYVRFRPVKQTEVDKVTEKANQSTDPDRELNANAAILAHACVGVFETVDGKPVGDPSSWPKFDQDLAHLLGIDEAEDGTRLEPTTTEIVRALYLTDGALLNTARALDAWSAPAIRRREEESAGN